MTCCQAHANGAMAQGIIPVSFSNLVDVSARRLSKPTPHAQTPPTAAMDARTRAPLRVLCVPTPTPDPGTSCDSQTPLLRSHHPSPFHLTSHQLTTLGISSECIGIKVGSVGTRDFSNVEPTKVHNFGEPFSFVSSTHNDLAIVQTLESRLRAR